MASLTERAIEKSVQVGQRVKLELTYHCGHVSFIETEVDAPAVAPMVHVGCLTEGKSVLSVRAVPDHDIRGEDMTPEEKREYARDAGLDLY